RSTRTVAGTGACAATIACNFPTSLIVGAESEPTVAGARAVLLELSSSSPRTRMSLPKLNLLLRHLRVPARKPVCNCAWPEFASRDLSEKISRHGAASRTYCAPEHAFFFPQNLGLLEAL